MKATEKPRSHNQDELMTFTTLLTPVWSLRAAATELTPRSSRLACQCLEASWGPEHELSCPCPLPPRLCAHTPSLVLQAEEESQSHRGRHRKHLRDKSSAGMYFTVLDGDLGQILQIGAAGSLRAKYTCLLPTLSLIRSTTKDPSPYFLCWPLWCLRAGRGRAGEG